MSFSRSQFDQACKEFIQIHACKSHESFPEDRGKLGWSWREHAYLPGFGFMERVTALHKHPGTTGSDRDAHENLDIELEPFDDAAAALTLLDELVCHQYIVLSPTFQVPTFYFSVNDSSGAPLALADVLQTSLFRRDAFQGADVTAHSVEQPNMDFPLLSFGDHPTLCSPCWYLHPCGTGSAVDEILEGAQGGTLVTEEHHVRWLECWFMVLGSLLDFRG